MQCSNCQSTLNATTIYCPQCGTFVDVRLEKSIAMIEDTAQTNQQRARGYYLMTAKDVPAGGRAHYQKRVEAILGKAAAEAGQPAAARPAPAPPAAAAAPAAPDPADPPKLVKPPAKRPSPPHNKGNRTVFVDFNQPPAEIVRVMDGVQAESESFSRNLRNIRRALRLFYVAGIPFILIDWLVGYNYLTFSLVAYTMWLMAIVGGFFVRRAGRPPNFGANYKLARDTFDIIRDDVAAGRTLVGWLDLTGPQQDIKKYRSKRAASGRPVSYYRDEWLNMKAPLHDGNVLRVSLIEKRKVREGYYKRSRISGKSKYKSGSSASQHYLRFSVSVAPGNYQLRTFDLRVKKIPNSRFVLESASAANDRITMEASANSSFDAWDVLEALRFGYDHLQPLEAGGA